MNFKADSASGLGEISQTFIEKAFFQYSEKSKDLKNIFLTVEHFVRCYRSNCVQKIENFTLVKKNVKYPGFAYISQIACLKKLRTVC